MLDDTRSGLSQDAQRNGASTLRADAWEVPWFVLQTKPGKHFLAANVIQHRFGFLLHCPMRVVRQTRTEVVREALFPGYLFVQFEPACDDWTELKWQPGVQRLLTTPSFRPLPLPVGFVPALLDHGDFVAPHASKPAIKVGDAVSVTGGAFAEHAGIVSLAAGKRVEVLMQIMGRSVRVIVSADDIVLVAAKA